MAFAISSYDRLRMVVARVTVAILWFSSVIPVMLLGQSRFYSMSRTAWSALFRRAPELTDAAKSNVTFFISRRCSRRSSPATSSAR